MKKRFALGIVLASTLGVLVAACGGGGGESGTVIEVKAEDYKFVPNEVTIPAGQTITLKLKNTTKQAHDLEVQGLQVEMMDGGMDMGGHEGAMPGTLALHTEKGKTASATFKADKAGTYEFWCTISGHKQLGMVGKLVVTSATGSPATKSESPPAPAPPASEAAPVTSNPQISFSDGGHEGH